MFESLCSVFRTLEVTRVSTIVSVIFEDFSSSNVDLKVFIKFYDFTLPSNGSSGSLTCASAKIPKNPSQDNILKDSLWNLTDSDCKLERNYSNFVGNGNTGIITCICNKPGTFAIIDHKTVDSNEVNMFVIFSKNFLLFSMSCLFTGYNTNSYFFLTNEFSRVCQPIRLFLVGKQ